MMQSETPTSERSAMSKAFALAVVFVVVLAVIFAWLLGFFTWLLS